MMRAATWCLISAMAIVGCGGTEPPATVATADPPLDNPQGPAGGPAAAPSPALAQGMALVKAEKYQEARAPLEEAMAKSPSAEAAFYLGLVKEKTGDRAGAEALYKKALSLDPAAAEASENLAALYLDDPPRPDEAIAVLKPAIAKSPQSAQLYVNLGFALGLKHDVEGSSKAFEVALSKKDDPDVRFMYGSMLFENKQLDAAATQLKKALPGAKDDPATLATYGRMLGASHAFAECVRAFDRAIKLKGDVAEFWVRRGTCRHELADEPGAQADFEKAVSIEPNFAAAHYYLGLSLAAQKKLGPAKTEIEKAEKLGKGTPIEKLAHDKLAAGLKSGK